jgi:deazaflavin-dependent oxidoreductase (nitroreductase family)
MTTAQDFNTPIIEEFRATEGKVGGRWEGKPLLLLHSVGARSGQERINPVAYQRLENSYAVFASKGGAPTNPDWYYNILAHPDVVIEVGTETLPVRARVAQGEERERIWEKQKRLNPNFAAYEQKTSRTIPVIVLEPRS